MWTKICRTTVVTLTHLNQMVGMRKMFVMLILFERLPVPIADPRLTSSNSLPKVKICIGYTF